MPETGQRIDPYAAFAFYVEIGGITEATFTQCSGLEVQVEVQEYQEGGCNEYVHKLPGRIKYGDLTLKYGTATSDQLWQWYLQVCQGQIRRQNLSVIVYDQAGEAVCRWNFKEAYPIKWTGPEFSAAEGRAAIDTLVIAHNGFEKAT